MKKRKPSGPATSEREQSGSGEQSVIKEVKEGEVVMRLVERKGFRSSATGPPSAGSASSKPGRLPKPKRGRLSRAVLTTLGKGLEDCFDEIRKQEVPERFKLLLRQF